MNEIGTVVNGLDADPFRQAARDLGDAFLHALDDIEGILAIARHRDARHHLALPVELGDTAALIRAELDAGDLTDAHWPPAVRLEHEVGDVARTAQITHAAHHVLGLGELHDASADIPVTLADHLPYALERNAIGLQLARVHDHLILLHEAADARHLGHAMRLGELVADEPVLQRPEFRQRAIRAQHRVLVDPADARRIGTEGRGDAARQPCRSGTQVLEDARARPVDVGAVLEDDVDERRAEEREAAHDLRPRHRQHRRRERIRHLILHHLRRLSGKRRVDDHLRVGQVGQRVHGCLHHRMDAGGNGEHRGDKHEHDVPCRPLDETPEHVSAPRDRDRGCDRDRRRAAHRRWPERATRLRATRSSIAPRAGCSRHRSGSSR